MRKTLFAGLVLFACSLIPISLAQQATDLKVHFIDVGTGDCIWIQTGDDGIDNDKLKGLNIIIDGGDNGSFGRIKGYDFISEYLIQEGRLPEGETIDWLILTHPHSDHNGGLPGFFRDYEVKNVLDPGHDKQAPGKEPDRLRPLTAYGKFHKAASEETFGDGQSATFHFGVPDDLVLDWGSELDVRVLWSSTEIVGSDLNNTSIVIRLSFTDSGNDASFLFTGDAEHFVEEHLIEELGQGLRTQVLKAGHHGSNSSTTVSFLKAVQPDHVVITVGNQSFSGTILPRPDTFVRIGIVAADLNKEIAVWRTDRNDKEPLLKPVGTEGGDDTVIAFTSGKAEDLKIRYVKDEASSTTTLDPARCQAMTQRGTQCKRSPSGGSSFCWQHGE